MDTVKFCKPMGGIFILLEVLLGIYGSSFPASPTQYIFVPSIFARGVMFMPGVDMLAFPASTEISRPVFPEQTRQIGDDSICVPEESICFGIYSEIMEQEKKLGTGGHWAPLQRFALASG